MSYTVSFLFQKYFNKTGIGAFILLSAAMLYSCKNDIEEINTLTSVSNLPTQSIRDFESIYSDSAKIQILVKAPEVNRYGNAAEPYVEFPNGIEVYFYDEFEQVNSMLTAKSALYHESEELWEARDSVVAINVDGEILNTDLLFWDEKRQLIYSNKFVKITTVNEVILGEGFEANQDFTDWVIKKPKGTIYLEEEY